MNFYDVFEADKDSWTDKVRRTVFGKKDNGSDPLGQEQDYEDGWDRRKTNVGPPPGTPERRIDITHDELPTDLGGFDKLFDKLDREGKNDDALIVKSLYDRVRFYHQVLKYKEQGSATQSSLDNAKASINRAIKHLVPYITAEEFATLGFGSDVNARFAKSVNQARKAAEIERTSDSTRDELPTNDLKSRFDDLEKAASNPTIPPGVKIYPDSIPLSKGTLATLNQRSFMQNVKDGLYNAQAVLGNQLFGIMVDKNWLKLFPKSFNALNNVHESCYRVAQDWIDNQRLPNTYEHINVHGIEMFIPKTEIVNKLATDVIADVASRFPDVAKYTTDVVQKESINEAVGTHDKLVATVANYMYVKHPEIFTQHGDGYVMTVVDDVVSKWEQQDEPMQDIKAYALEVMDALGTDRTNENRAQIKTDYKGHHLVNADGEEVSSYPKDAEGLKKARNTLYINHKGLNTMKQEGLNEAFEAALEKLSLNESVTINTTSSSEGEDTVTVTATAEDALELVALLKAAGLPHKADEVQSQIVAAPCGEQVEEEFANEPTDDAMNGDMDHMNTQSGGLNRRKMQQKYANPLGDNPLAESEDLLRGLWDLYKEAK